MLFLATVVPARTSVTSSDDTHRLASADKNLSAADEMESSSSNETEPGLSLPAKESSATSTPNNSTSDKDLKESPMQEKGGFFASLSSFTIMTQVLSLHSANVICWLSDVHDAFYDFLTIYYF